MAQRILVTGANGSVGRQVVEQLSLKGATVRAGVRSMSRGAALAKFEPEIVEMDFGHPETLDLALTGVDRVFLLTPFDPTMSAMTEAILTAAKTAGVTHVARLSAIGADTEPGIALAQWHRAAERTVEESGIPFTHLRPNGFMQNFSTMTAETIKTQDAFYAPAEIGQVSFVDTRDIAATAAAVLTESGHEGKAYTITGPEAITHDQIAEFITEAVGRKITFVDVSPDVARSAMTQGGMPQLFADALIELYGLYREGHASEVTTVVKDISGRAPITFAQYAAEYADSFR